MDLCVEVRVQNFHNTKQDCQPFRRRLLVCGLEYRSRYIDSQRDGRSVDRIPVGARFFAPFQTRPGAQPPPVRLVPGLFTGGKAAGSCR